MVLKACFAHNSDTAVPISAVLGAKLQINNI